MQTVTHASLHTVLRQKAVRANKIFLLLCFAACAGVKAEELRTGSRGDYRQGLR